MVNFEKAELVDLTADIVSAYVANNALVVSELPQVIGAVHTALSRACQQVATGRTADQKPAVSAKKSLTPDFLICLEDGKKFKSLKRHLRSRYNMSPEQYREKWGLDPDYPMVAPNYAKTRSALAKKIGLGKKRK